MSQESELSGQEIHAFRHSPFLAMIYVLTLPVHSDPLTLYRYWPYRVEALVSSQYHLTISYTVNYFQAANKFSSVFSDRKILRLKVKAGVTPNVTRCLSDLFLFLGFAMRIYISELQFEYEH